MGLFGKSKKKSPQGVYEIEVPWVPPAVERSLPSPPAEQSAARPRAAPAPLEEAFSPPTERLLSAHEDSTAWLPVESSSSAVLLQALSEAGIELEDDFEQGLRLRFLQFASFGKGTVANEMDSLRFAKLVSDSGIVALCPDQLPVQALDTIFARARPKGASKLDFGSFVVALVLIARRIQGFRAGLDEVMQCVLKTEGPPLPGSAAGGLTPQQIQQQQQEELLIYQSQLQQQREGEEHEEDGEGFWPRQAAAMPPLPLGSPTAAAGAEEESLVGATALVRLASTMAEKGAEEDFDVSDDEVSLSASIPESLPEAGPPRDEGPSVEALLTVFQANASFNAGGEGVLDGLRFAKLCREAGLTKSMHVTHADLAFGRAAGKAGRVLDFKQFLRALHLLAEALGCSELEVQRAIAAWERPQRSTQPKPAAASPAGLARGLTPRGQVGVHAAGKAPPGARVSKAPR